MALNKLNFFLPLLRPLPEDLRKYLSQKTVDMSYTNLLRMARIEANEAFNPGLERVEMESVAIDVAFHWNNRDGVITKSSLRTAIGIAATKYLEGSETKSMEHNIETKPHTRGEKTQELVSTVQDKTHKALSFDPEEHASNKPVRGVDF
jgi:hypothetical protein